MRVCVCAHARMCVFSTHLNHLTQKEEKTDSPSTSAGVSVLYGLYLCMTFLPEKRPAKCLYT